MKTYILIMVLQMYRGGVAIESIEFSSLEKCNTARSALIVSVAQIDGAVCVEK